MKNLIVFDLDGTLAESKSPLDTEMATLIGRLLAVIRVAVISGGAWPQFQTQLLGQLADNESLNNLSLLPTCGTRFYRRKGTWQSVYAEDFAADVSKRIVAALYGALDASGFRAAHTWGDIVEDRGSQITLSALGQNAPLDAKRVWDPDFKKREAIKAMLEPSLPGFSVHLGGATSIDVTRPGIDKAYGIAKLHEILDIAIADMIFIGDALFPGGNDYPAKQAGVLSIAVRDPHETKRVVEAIIACQP
jgi:phosphomannomutase